MTNTIDTFYFYKESFYNERQPQILKKRQFRTGYKVGGEYIYESNIFFSEEGPGGYLNKFLDTMMIQPGWVFKTKMGLRGWVIWRKCAYMSGSIV